MSQVYNLRDKRAEDRIERLLKAVENLDRAVRMFVPDYPEDEQIKEIVRRKRVPAKGTPVLIS